MGFAIGHLGLLLPLCVHMFQCLLGWISACFHIYEIGLPTLKGTEHNLNLASPV